MRNRWQPLILAWSLGACGTDAPARFRATVTDSAGVRVVVSPASPLPTESGWRLGPQPMLEIGVVDGAPEYQFFRVPSGTVLSGGTIVVADAGSRELRAYDAEGRHLWSAGGAGEGPGEFRGLDAHWRIRADSILAWDFQARRVSVFDPSGAFARSFVPAGGGNVRTPFLAGVLRDGTLVVRYGSAYGRSATEPGPVRRRVEIRLEQGDGTLGGSLGEFPGSEDLVMTLRDGSPAVIGVVFGRGLHVSGGGDRVAVANDDAFSIRLYGSAGQLLHVVRLDREPRPVRDEDFQALLQRGLENDNPLFQELARERFRQTPRHTTFPAFASIRLDASRNLWVEEYRPPGVERRVWHVFDPDGVLVTRLETPAGLRILDIGEDHVLGVFVDDLGVESLRLYRLEKLAS